MSPEVVKPAHSSWMHQINWIRYKSWISAVDNSQKPFLCLPQYQWKCLLLNPYLPFAFSESWTDCRMPNVHINYIRVCLWNYTPGCVNETIFQSKLIVVLTESNRWLMFFLWRWVINQHEQSWSGSVDSLVALWLYCWPSHWIYSILFEPVGTSFIFLILYKESNGLGQNSTNMNM